MTTTDSKTFWVEDRYASRCYLCNQKFSLIRRRHHCRQCGQIFCGDCLENVPISNERSGGQKNATSTPEAVGVEKIGRGLVSLLGIQRDEKICLSCVKQRKARQAAAAQSTSAVGAAAAILHQRRDTMTTSLRGKRSGSQLEVRSNADSNGRQTPPLVPPPIVVVDEDDGYRSHDASAAGSPEGDHRSAPHSPRALLLGMDNFGKKHYHSGATTPNNVPSSPTAKSFDMSRTLVSASELESPRVHKESAKERSITYGVSEIPMTQTSSMALWLKKALQAAEAESLKRQHAQSSRQGSLQVMRRRKGFMANPRANFRTGERVPEAGLFATAFLDSGAFEAKTGILDVLESRCSTHLLRRMRWLIHEVNLRHSFVDRVRRFHQLRLEKVVSPNGGVSPDIADENILLSGAGKRLSIVQQAVRNKPIGSPRSPHSPMQSSVAHIDALPPPDPLVPVREWLAPLCDIAWRVVSQTSCERDPNILDHVDVLTLEGGDFCDTEIIHGIAFLQHNASKKMKPRIDAPRVLLLGGDVGLHMAVTETKSLPSLLAVSPNALAQSSSSNTIVVPGGGVGYVSGNTVVVPAMEFSEYATTYPGSLEKLYQRIQVWKPTLILVEKGMHHFLQDRIVRDAHQITLLTNVGRSLLERIEVSTGAQIVNDLQAVSISELQEGRYAPLGYCNSFQMSVLDPKRPPVVMLSGLPRPTFTTILLRGANKETLGAAKELLRHGILSAHHLALQTHYLVDFNAVVAQEHHSYGLSSAYPNDEAEGGMLADDGNASSRDLLREFSTGFEEPESCPEGPRTSFCDFDGGKYMCVPPEALSVNLGVSFPLEVLQCGATKSTTYQRGKKHSNNGLRLTAEATSGQINQFVAAARLMRDNIIVNNIFLEGPNSNNNNNVDNPSGGNQTSSASPSATGSNSTGQMAVGVGVNGNSNGDQSTSNNLLNGATDDVSVARILPSVEASETVRKQRYVYPFYQEGDETLWEFLVERVNDSRDSLRHIVHGKRRIIVRSVTQMKDVFDDIQRPSTVAGMTPPASTRFFGDDPFSGDTQSSLTAPFATPGIHHRIAEQLSELFLKQLSTPARFVRVPHCYTTCKECLRGRYSQVASSMPIPVSPHTLSMSFGSFLELSTYMTEGCIVMCGHTLHNDIIRNFVLYPTDGMQVTVSFEVEPLPVYDVHGPPLQLRAIEERTVVFSAPVANHQIRGGTSEELSKVAGSLPMPESPPNGAPCEPAGDGLTLTSSPSRDDLTSIQALGMVSPEAVRPPPILNPSALAAPPPSMEQQMGSQRGSTVLYRPSTSTEPWANCAPKTMSFTCRNATELYFASEMQELSRNLNELRHWRTNRFRSVTQTITANSPNNFDAAASPATENVATMLALTEERVVKAFVQLKSLEDILRFRIRILNPYIDEVVDRSATLPSSTVDGTVSTPMTGGAVKSMSRNSSQYAQLDVQKVRSPTWAYLPNERVAIRTNEPTSIISAVLTAMQRPPPATVADDSVFEPPPVLRRQHTRTMSLTDESRQSRVAQYLQQFSSAVGLSSARPQQPNAIAAGSGVGALPPRESVVSAASTGKEAQQQPVLASGNPLSPSPFAEVREMPAIGETFPTMSPCVSVAAEKRDDGLLNPNHTRVGSAASENGVYFGDEVLSRSVTPSLVDVLNVPQTQCRSSLFHPMPQPSAAVTITPPQLLGEEEAQPVDESSQPRLVVSHPPTPNAEDNLRMTTPTGGMGCVAPTAVTTIEQVLESTLSHAALAEVTNDAVIGEPTPMSPPFGQSADVDPLSQTAFIRDAFQKEDEAIDVLAGKSATTTGSQNSFKYVLTDVFLPDENSSKSHSQNIVVEVMFPHQFAAMRFLYAKDEFQQPDKSSPGASCDADDGITASLLRCRPFKPEGGKSKAEFFITQDNRLMLKQIKLTELKHFVHFAPSYFAQMVQVFSHVQHQKKMATELKRYLARVAREDQEGDEENPSYEPRSPETLPSTADSAFSLFSSTNAEDCPPSALSKIFGIFSVQVKKGRRRFPDTSLTSDIKYYMLMENLTFRRPLEICYDLKGSQRKRHAAEGALVLLDQDLVRETRKGFFFFCKESTRSWVLDSLCNDSQVLSSSDIMDYSLIVAVDKKGETVTIGVIDYLHPYTGAKVLESKVKGGLENVFGQGRDPTIVEPAHYKQRFLRWMDGYFCAVPDKMSAIRKRGGGASISSGTVIVVDGAEYRVV